MDTILSLNFEDISILNLKENINKLFNYDKDNKITILQYLITICDYEKFVEILDYCILNNIKIILSVNYIYNYIYLILDLKLYDFLEFMLNKILYFPLCFENININIVNISRYININQTIKITIIGNNNIGHITCDNINKLVYILKIVKIMEINNIITTNEFIKFLNYKNDLNYNIIEYLYYQLCMNKYNIHKNTSTDKIKSNLDTTELDLNLSFIEEIYKSYNVNFNDNIVKLFTNCLNNVELLIITFNKLSKSNNELLNKIITKHELEIQKSLEIKNNNKTILFTKLYKNKINELQTYFINLKYKLNITTSKHITSNTYIPNVYVFEKIFTETICKNIKYLLNTYIKYCENNDINLDCRHDNNISGLEKYTFLNEFNNYINIFVNLYVNKLFNNTFENKNSDYIVKKYVVNHMFYLNNYESMEEKDYKIHKDKSLYTLNLCLDISDDCEGSYVSFYDDNNVLENNYIHSTGSLVLHNGNKIHKANKLTKGFRQSIIFWINEL